MNTSTNTSSVIHTRPANGSLNRAGRKQFLYSKVAGGWTPTVRPPGNIAHPGAGLSAMRQRSFPGNLKSRLPEGEYNNGREIKSRLAVGSQPNYRRTVMENPNYEQIVSEAAKWLDKHEPGWHEKINQETLKITGCTKCIMGQLYGDYAVGMRKHFPKNSGWDPYHPLGPAFGDGFANLGDVVLMKRLKSLWLAEINSRLEADKRQEQSEADKFLERTTEIINLPVLTGESQDSVSQEVA